MAKDALGQDLKVGDKVIFMQIGYRNFVEGTIKSMTPKTAMIGHKMTNVCSTESRQFYNQIILDTRGLGLEIKVEHGVDHRINK